MIPNRGGGWGCPFTQGQAGTLTTSYSSNSSIHSTNSVPLNTKQGNHYKLMKRPIVLIFQTLNINYAHLKLQ